VKRVRRREREDECGDGEERKKKIDGEFINVNGRNTVYVLCAAFNLG